jgi:hypothetical protein
MAFLFDTDAISDLLRPRPAMAHLKWLKTVSREEQFTSAHAANTKPPHKLMAIAPLRPSPQVIPVWFIR